MSCKKRTRHGNGVEVQPRQGIEPREPRGLVTAFVFAQNLDEEEELPDLIVHPQPPELLHGRIDLRSEFLPRARRRQDHFGRYVQHRTALLERFGRNDAPIHSVFAGQLEAVRALDSASRSPLVHGTDVARRALVDVHRCQRQHGGCTTDTNISGGGGGGRRRCRCRRYRHSIRLMNPGDEGEWGSSPSKLVDVMKRRHRRRASTEAEGGDGRSQQRSGKTQFHDGDSMIAVTAID